jgi:hypothetical protein
LQPTELSNPIATNPNNQCPENLIGMACIYEIPSYKLV